MSLYGRVSTGLKGLDEVIDHLRFGDNVVWQVDSIPGYRKMVGYFAESARNDNRDLVYIRFAAHEPLLDEASGIKTCHVDARKGFESFAVEVHNIIESHGRRAFYVFDCLTGLLEYWYSDLMIGNFFRATCPLLFELDTVAYFAIIRGSHTYGTIAGIRETTQLLLDLYQINEKIYIHPLKVWQRYSPTMFFPHLIQGQNAVCITSSSDASELFNSINRGEIRLDYWNTVFANAKRALGSPGQEQEEVKRQLMHMLIGSDSRMFHLCDRYFTLQDILAIALREIGTGFIGGKSVGMLLARKVLEIEGGERFSPFRMIHSLSVLTYFTPISCRTAGGNSALSKKRPKGITDMPRSSRKSFCTEHFRRISRSSSCRCWSISASLQSLYAQARFWRIISAMHSQASTRAFSASIRVLRRNAMKRLNRLYASYMQAP